MDESIGNDDNDGIFLLRNASTCIESDLCGLDEAGSYLSEILDAQRECEKTTGTTNDVLCDNVADIAEVVANLRRKVETERNHMGPHNLILLKFPMKK
jgi:hypothetical protein